MMPFSPFCLTETRLYDIKLQSWIHIDLPMEGGECVTKVVVEPDESFESALKRFKKQCEKAGLLSELRKRQHYEKPSVKRKRKALAARKKVKRRERYSE